MVVEFSLLKSYWIATVMHAANLWPSGLTWPTRARKTKSFGLFSSFCSRHKCCGLVSILILLSIHAVKVCSNCVYLLVRRRQQEILIIEVNPINIIECNYLFNVDIHYKTSQMYKGITDHFQIDISQLIPRFLYFLY